MNDKKKGILVAFCLIQKQILYNIVKNTLSLYFILESFLHLKFKIYFFLLFVK